MTIQEIMREEHPREHWVTLLKTVIDRVGLQTTLLILADLCHGPTPEEQRACNELRRFVRVMEGEEVND